jgi:phosphohistidine phosphatase SixA
MPRRFGSIRFAPALSVLAAALACAAQPALARPLSAPSLLQRLRAGGCVLIMRHASAPRAEPDAHAAEPDNPRRERQLDDAGKADARALGAALRALHIPIGPIYSSPTYRALETIRLAGLGTPRIVAQLGEGEHGMLGAAEQPRLEWLRRAVKQAPPAGRNALVVTHTPNIVGAFGREAADIRAGEMLIFQPDRAGKAELLGRLTVKQWRDLARKR